MAWGSCARSVSPDPDDISWPVAGPRPWIYRELRARSVAPGLDETLEKLEVLRGRARAAWRPGLQEHLDLPVNGTQIAAKGERELREH